MSQKILIIEDEEGIIHLLNLYLKDAGYDVVVAKDGADGLALHARTHPDLVILDVIMPHKNGYQVCRQLKNDPQTHDIKIILFTVQNQQADCLWVMHQGADAYLAKPFHETELLATIARVLP